MILTPQSSRKRGCMRSFFSRSPSPLPNRPARATPTSAQTSRHNPADSRNASGILADALETLTAKDREKVRKLLPANVIGIDAAIAEAQACASELQQLCVKNRWSWDYKGRQIHVADQVDKILRFLDKFKTVGDVVANVDPVHVGLPWAGVRAILEVCVQHEAGFLSAS
jgi:hypothetical protein